MNTGNPNQEPELDAPAHDLLSLEEILQEDEYPSPPRVLRWLRTAFLIAGSAGILIMTAHILVDVCSRWLFNRPFLETLDFMKYWWMPFIGFTGIAVAQFTGEHIRVMTLPEALNARARKVLEVVTLLIFGAFTAVMLYAGTADAIDAFEKQEYAPTSNLPVWLPEFVYPLSMALLMACIGWQIVHALRTSRSEVDN